MQHLSRDEDVSMTLFQGMEGLESLRNSWSEIVSGMTRRHFFHLWEWHHSYLQCLESNPDNMMFFLFIKGEKPIAIFPLQFTEISLGGLKLKALAFPSHNHMLICDLVCQGEALRLPLFQVLGQYLRNQGKAWDIIQLSHMLEDAGAMQIINFHPPARFLLKQEGRCDFMETAGTYESFLSGLSKNFRRSLKRARQHLDELPGVQFTFTQNGSELEERLKTFMDVEASGWKGATGIGTAIKLHQSLRCFYQSLTRTLSATGKVSINGLVADGKCIASQFCLLLDETAYILKIGYDEGYKRYAPGNLLVDLFIKRSMEGGTIKKINLITDAEWHVDWKPKSYDKSQLYIFNATPAGLIGFFILKSIPFFKKPYHSYLKSHLPKRIQAWIASLSHET